MHFSSIPLGQPTVLAPVAERKSPASRQIEKFTVFLKAFTQYEFTLGACKGLLQTDLACILFALLLYFFHLQIFILSFWRCGLKGRGIELRVWCACCVLWLFTEKIIPCVVIYIAEPTGAYFPSEAMAKDCHDSRSFAGQVEISICWRLKTLRQWSISFGDIQRCFGSEKRRTEKRSTCLDFAMSPIMQEFLHKNGVEILVFTLNPDLVLNRKYLNWNRSMRNTLVILGML